MSDIFLSYAADDRNSIRSLVQALQGQAWSVWWDRRILPGQHWPEVIEKALASCRVVVVVWTVKSIKSRWVRLEANAGAQIDGLIPIRLDEVDPPFEFRHIQAADLTGWDGASAHPELDSAMTAIREKMGVGKHVNTRAKAPTSLASDTDLALSLSLGGDFGSTDPHDLDWIHKQVQSLGKRAVPALVAALEFPEPARRGHAAYLLGWTGDPDVVGELKPLLSDRSEVGIDPRWPTVRIAAATSLKRIGTMDALQALAEGFQ
jgi:hypothetical protein